MESGDAVIEETKEMGEVVGGGFAVAEDDDGFGHVGCSEEEHVEVVFAMGDGYLKVHLFKRGWDGEGLCVYLADEDG